MIVNNDNDNDDNDNNNNNNNNNNNDAARRDVASTEPKQHFSHVSASHRLNPAKALS